MPGFVRVGPWPRLRGQTVVMVGFVAVTLLALAGIGVDPLYVVLATVAVAPAHEALHALAARAVGARRIVARVTWVGPYVRWYGFIPARREAIIAVSPQVLTVLLVAAWLLFPAAGWLLLAAAGNVVGGASDYANVVVALRQPHDARLWQEGDGTQNGLYAPA